MIKNAKILKYLEIVAPLIQLPLYWENTDSIILGGNEAVFQNSGALKESAYVGKTLYELYPKEMADHIKQHNEEVMRTGLALSQEEVIEDISTGKIKYFMASKSPIHDDHGNVIGIVGTSFEITQQREAEKKRLEAEEKQRFLEKVAFEQKLQAEKDKQILGKQIESLYMASNTIAHELRTPLCDIAAANAFSKDILEAIKDHIPEKKYKMLLKNCHRIEVFSQQTQKFINIILENAKDIEQTPLDAIDIAPVIQDAIADFPYKNKDEKDKVSYDGNLSFSIYGDAHLLKHLIWNLIKNSLYFIEEQGKGEISIWATADKNFNYLHFKDTAKGVSATEKAKMFNPYYTKTQIGTGVGLNFCNRVMKTFQGFIDCESVEGEYIEFIMKFPKIKE